MRVRVRGIYSTAIARLLIDRGHEIVDPTESQRRRFGSASQAPPDIMIWDTEDREGIVLEGRASSVDDLVDILSSISWQVVVKSDGPREGDFARASVYFPIDAKLALDALRSKVTYTLPMHHYLRVAGPSYSHLVTICEELVEDGRVEPEVVEAKVSGVIDSIRPRVGSRIVINHVKLNGRNIVIGPATVVSRREAITLKRTIKGFGRYDGLDVEKVPGDVAISKLERFGWTLRTSYYGLGDRLKGIYVNVSTPIHVYDERIWYVDLGIDVVASIGYRPTIIDEDHLNVLLDKRCISKEMHERALKVANEALDELSTWGL